MGCIRRTILTPNRLFLPLLTASVEGFDTVFTEYFTPVHKIYIFNNYLRLFSLQMETGKPISKVLNGP